MSVGGVGWLLIMTTWPLRGKATYWLKEIIKLRDPRLCLLMIMNFMWTGVKNVWITEKFNLEQTLDPFPVIRLTLGAWSGDLLLSHRFPLPFLLPVLQ